MNYIRLNCEILKGIDQVYQVYDTKRNIQTQPEDVDFLIFKKNRWVYVRAEDTTPVDVTEILEELYLKLKAN